MVPWYWTRAGREQAFIKDSISGMLKIVYMRAVGYFNELLLFIIIDLGTYVTGHDAIVQPS